MGVGCWLQGVVEDGFVETIGFAHLTLHVVAVDGMLEMLLGYTDQNLYRRLPRGQRLRHIYYS